MRFFYGNELEPRTHTLKCGANHCESWKMLISLQHLHTILLKLPTPARFLRVNYCCRRNGSDLHQLPSTGTRQCQSCRNRLGLTYEPHCLQVRAMQLWPTTPLPSTNHTRCPCRLGPLRRSGYLLTCAWHIWYSRSFPTCSSWQQQREALSSGPSISFGLFESSIHTWWAHQ